MFKLFTNLVPLRTMNLTDSVRHISTCMNILPRFNAEDYGEYLNTTIPRMAFFDFASDFFTVGSYVFHIETPSDVALAFCQIKSDILMA